jgi:hypothetical protein
MYSRQDTFRDETNSFEKMQSLFEMAAFLTDELIAESHPICFSDDILPVSSL